MCFGTKTPKVKDPAQVQIAAPEKAVPLRLSDVARSSIAGKGINPSSLRIPLNVNKK